MIIKYKNVEHDVCIFHWHVALMVVHTGTDVLLICFAGIFISTSVSPASSYIDAVAHQSRFPISLLPYYIYYQFITSITLWREVRS